MEMRGYQESSDDKIISQVLGYADVKIENSENDENVPPQQVEAFETYMKWMDPQQMMFLQKVKNDAGIKRSASLKQLNMTDFMQ